MIGTGDLLRYNHGTLKPIALPILGELGDLTKDGKRDLVGTVIYTYSPDRPPGGIVCYPRVGSIDRFEFADPVAIRYLEHPQSNEARHLKAGYLHLASGRLHPPSQFRRQPTVLRSQPGSDRIPHRQRRPPQPGCPGLDRLGDLPYSRPGRADEPLLSGARPPPGPPATAPPRRRTRRSTLRPRASPSSGSAAGRGCSARSMKSTLWSVPNVA